VKRFHRNAGFRRQQGVTLIVAMIVLVIIGLTSAAVMRGALSTDIVANNSRVQTLAMQAAQIGLKYCEIQTLQTIKDITVLDVNPPEQWDTFANWAKGAGMANEVPEAYMKSENGTFSPDHLPQCMAQKVDVNGKTVYQITARGFSPDYTQDGGFTETGSVVWLQSIVYLH
jgi:type IV pilus assembly protein PilX